MAFAITTEQEQLAEAVSSFAARHAPIDKTRASLDSIVAGDVPPWWDELAACGFHAVHLPERAGGQGGSLTDLGCVIEAAAAALLPGPLLATAIASAVANIADDSGAGLLADLVAGSTAALVLPEDSNVRAVREDDGWHLEGICAPMLGVASAQRILLAAHTDVGVRWFSLDVATDRHGLSVESRRGTDLTSDVGVLALSRHVVPASAELCGINREQAR